MRRVLGWTLAAAPFVGATIFGIYSVGWKYTGLGVAITIVIVACIYSAEFLLNPPTPPDESP